MLSACRLRAVWNSQRVEALVPSNPKRFVGTIAHRLLERALTSHFVGALDRQLASLWDDLVAETEEHMLRSPADRRFVPLVKFVPDMMVLRAKAMMRASEIASAKSSSREGAMAPSRVGGEISVRSRKGLLTGRVDRVIETENGVVLQDYKSGPLTARDGGAADIKPEFRQQLQLYAILYFETIGVWPMRLELVPLVGDSANVPFAPAECQTLLDEAENAVYDVSAALAKFATTPELAEEQLAQPSPKVCKFCSYRPACSTYLSVDRRAPDDEWPADVWGTVTSVTKLGNGNLAIGIRTANGDVLYVRDVDESMLQSRIAVAGSVGHQVGVFGARFGGSPKAMEAGPYTVIFLSIP
ncbi:MAG: PD-(D/E)XK nuclease family protein [Candidatus Cybelea sp.]|jgi:hypothetical protein